MIPESGLIVDTPEKHVISNDGNTNRRNFVLIKQRHCVNFIERFAALLEIISGGHEANIEKTYCFFFLFGVVRVI